MQNVYPGVKQTKEQTNKKKKKHIKTLQNAFEDSTQYTIRCIPKGFLLLAIALGNNITILIIQILYYCVLYLII